MKVSSTKNTLKHYLWNMCSHTNNILYIKYYNKYKHTHIYIYIYEKYYFMF